MQNSDYNTIKRIITGFTNNLDFFNEFVKIAKTFSIKYNILINRVKRFDSPFELTNLEKQKTVNCFNTLCHYQWKININLLNLRKHYKSIELDDFIFNLLITYSDNINRFRLRIIKLLDTKGFMLRSIHDYNKKKTKGLLGEYITGLLVDDKFNVETDKRIKMIEEEEKELDDKVDTNKIYHLYDVDEDKEVEVDKKDNTKTGEDNELSDSIINEIHEMLKDPSQVKQKEENDVTDLGVAFNHKNSEVERVSAIEKCERPSQDSHEKSLEEVRKMEEEMNKIDNESYSFENSQRDK